MSDLKTLQDQLAKEIKTEFEAYLAQQKTSEEEGVKAREKKKKFAETHIKDLRPEATKYEAYNKEMSVYTEKQVATIREKHTKAGGVVNSMGLADASEISITNLGGNGAGLLVLPATSMLLSSDQASESDDISTEAIVYNSTTNKPWAKAWGGGWGCFNSGIGSTSQWAEFGFWFRPDATRFHNFYPLNVLRGFLLSIANDEWYDCKHSRVDIDVFTDVWQYNWKGQQQHHLLTIEGDNINVNNRFDRNQWTQQNALLAAGDWAYLRVSVRLYVYARGGGSYAELNFNAGTANYIQVPYCYIF